MNAEEVRALAARLARATEVDDETRLMRIDGEWHMVTGGEAFALAVALWQVCRWTPPCDEEGPWRTGCGHAWEFTVGGPGENKQRFCGYCGGALVEFVGAWHCDQADCGDGGAVKVDEDGCCAYCGHDARWVEADADTTPPAGPRQTKAPQPCSICRRDDCATEHACE